VLTNTEYVELVINGLGTEELKRVQTTKRDRADVREIAEAAADATAAQKAAALKALTT